MAKQSINIDIARSTESELCDRSLTMAKGIETNASKLPNIPIPPSKLRERVAKIIETRSEINEVKAKLAQLEEQNRMESEQLKSDFKSNAVHVEHTINTTSDTSLAGAVGLKFRDKPSRGNAIEDTGVPTNVRLSEKKNTSGVLLLDFNKVSNVRSYGIIWGYGSTQPSEWPSVPMKIVTTSQNVELPLESGKRVWVAVKSYRSRGIESGWSDVVSRIVP